MAATTSFTMFLPSCGGVLFELWAKPVKQTKLSTAVTAPKK
jgi:hypothetical protein